MYLSILDNSKKHLFLDLELYLANIDSDFSDEEKKIIDTHCLEMHIDNNGYQSEEKLDVVLSRIDAECSKKEKRVIYLELIATVVADNVFHEKERELIERLSDLMGISPDESADIINVIQSMKDNYKKCAEFVKGE